MGGGNYGKLAYTNRHTSYVSQAYFGNIELVHLAPAKLKVRIMPSHFRRQLILLTLYCPSTNHMPKAYQLTVLLRAHVPIPAWAGQRNFLQYAVLSLSYSGCVHDCIC